MRYLCTRPDARACRERQSRGLADLLERERVELWRDLALEPCLVSLAWMLARPAAIAAVSVANRLASRFIHDSAAARIDASGSVRCEHFASLCDRAQSVLAPCFRHAGIAMAAPALEDRFAAHRARGRIGRARFDGWRAPCARCIRSRLPALARRCEQRRSLRTGNAASLISRFDREHARRCALIDQRFAERLPDRAALRPRARAS